MSTRRVVVTGLGVITSLGAATATPPSPLHFAGADWSPRWPGYMDGAIRSGEKAAATAPEIGRLAKPVMPLVPLVTMNTWLNTPGVVSETTTEFPSCDTASTLPVIDELLVTGAAVVVGV